MPVNVNSAIPSWRTDRQPPHCHYGPGDLCLGAGRRARPHRRHLRAHLRPPGTAHPALAIRHPPRSRTPSRAKRRRGPPASRAPAASRGPPASRGPGPPSRRSRQTSTPPGPQSPNRHRPAHPHPRRNIRARPAGEHPVPHPKTPTRTPPTRTRSPSWHAIPQLARDPARRALNLSQKPSFGVANPCAICCIINPRSSIPAPGGR